MEQDSARSVINIYVFGIKYALDRRFFKSTRTSGETVIRWSVSAPISKDHETVMVRDHRNGYEPRKVEFTFSKIVFNVQTTLLHSMTSILHKSVETC